MSDHAQQRAAGPPRGVTYASGQPIDDDLIVTEHIGGTRKVDIYACRSKTLGRRVACKVLRPEYRIHFSSLTAVQVEGEMLARLRHPNVVEGYRYALLPDPIVVMKLLEGQDLKTAFFTGNYRAFRIGHAVSVARQIATALDYVHQQGILHLDVKPSNVFYGNGHATLIDFSVAREFDPDHLPKDNAGTRDWMAPEQTFRERVGPYTDVFGLGVVFYQLLTGGKLPYRAIEQASEDEDESPVKVPDYDAPPEHPRTVNPAAPEALGDVALKAVAPDKDKRFATPADLLDAIERAS